MLRWGDMGGQWGVNRSVAQIQALLFLSDRPLTAEDIAETLGMARSNVSNSIRELLSWKLIRRVPVLGDRRDHYEAEADLWQIMTHIARGRKEREIDPAVAALRHVLETADDDPQISATAAHAPEGDAELPRDARHLVQPDGHGAAGHPHGADEARHARGQPGEPGPRFVGEEGEVAGKNFDREFLF